MKKILITLTIALLSGFAAKAQNELSGTVKDSTDNNALPGVTIYIPDLKLAAVTSAEGTFTIHNIPNGIYLVQVSAIGYATQIKEINGKETSKVDFKLSKSSMEMKEVIVTGVSSATEAQSNTVSVDVVTHDDFMQNSSTNLVDAISVAPSVNSMTLGPEISKPFIRGLGYNRVVTVNDGVRQEGQQWFDEFGEEIDEYSVDRVEILKGPTTLSYGSDAFAGVINMLAAPTLPEGTIKGNVLANYQTNNGLFGESFNLAGNLKGFVWDLRYSNKMAHCYQNKYDGYVANSGYSESNIKAMVGINRKWGYSHLTFSDFDMKLGIIEGARDSATGKFLTHYHGFGNTDSMGIAPESDFTKYNNFPVIHQHVRHYKAVLDNSIALGSGRLGLRLGLQQNYRREANDITKTDSISGGYNNYFFLQTINYDLRYTLPEKNHFEFAVGINGMSQNSQDRGIVFVIPEYSIFDIGGFAIAKKEFKKLSISGGLRYDMRTTKVKEMWVNSANGKRIDGYQDSTSYQQFAPNSASFSGLSGSLGMAYDFNENVYGKINVARGYRAPSIPESGSNGIHDGTPFYEIGDPNLKAESSLQVDATLGINTEDFTLEADAFYNQINNYIFPEKLQSKLGGDSMRTDVAAGFGGPAFKYVQGDAVLSGGEAIFNLHPHTLKGFHWNNSFGMVNAVQLNQPDSSKYLPYTPPYKYHSELKLIMAKSGTLLKNSYIKFGMDYFFEQNKVFYKFGNETVTPEYTLFNAGVGSDFCTKKGTTVCSLFISVNNIGDVAYQSSMSRLKYTDPNNVTGRIGVYNMGRTVSVKLIIPIGIKK
jgi:iron complex outermembrane receptor protein